MNPTNDELKNIKRLLTNPNYDNINLGIEIATKTFNMTLEDIVNLFDENDIYDSFGDYGLTCFGYSLFNEDKNKLILNMRSNVSTMLKYYIEFDKYENTTRR